MKNLNILLLTTILAFTTNCGFKVVDRSKLSNFSIIDITTVGENRINYKLKMLKAFYAYKSKKINHKNYKQIDLVYNNRLVAIKK